MSCANGGGQKLWAVALKSPLSMTRRFAARFFYEPAQFGRQANFKTLNSFRQTLDIAASGLNG
jgi:hypothetical protein